MFLNALTATAYLLFPVSDCFIDPPNVKQTFHHHHPPSYIIKRSTVNVYKIDSG